MPLEQCYTFEEVQNCLKVGRSALLRHIAKGKIQCFTLHGGGMRFKESDIEKFIENSRKVITPRNQNKLE
ncbi:MAG: helix-turn-helix domain-containing protein [Lentisphaerota bacterium]